MRKRKVSAVLGSGIVATLMSKSNLLADDFGTYTTGVGPFADNSNHDYCILDPTNWGSDDYIMHDAMDYLAGYTDMTTSFNSSCGAHDDVQAKIYDLSGALRGKNTCRVALNGAGRCDTSLVRIDTQEILTEAYNAEPSDWLYAFYRNVHYTLRHEIGHSVGMKHYFSLYANLDQNSNTPDEATLTMNSPHAYDDSQTLYAQHHKDHVNAKY